MLSFEVVCSVSSAQVLLPRKMLLDIGNVTCPIPNNIFTARCDESAVFAVMQCLSVTSRSWITSKRINIFSKFFHHRVATPL